MRPTQREKGKSYVEGQLLEWIGNWTWSMFGCRDVKTSRKLMGMLRGAATGSQKTITDAGGAATEQLIVLTARTLEGQLEILP